MLLLSLLSFDHLKKFGQLYIIISLLIMVALFYIRMKDAQSDAAQYKSELSICSNNLEIQNAAIAEWRREGEVLKERVQEANKAVEKLRIESDKGLQAIITANVPEQCEAAIRWGIDQVQR